MLGSLASRLAAPARSAFPSAARAMSSNGIVFNIIGGRDMTLQEINAAAEVIYDSVDPNANIIFGALVDDTIDDDSISITVLATGFKLSEREEQDLDRSSALFGNVGRAKPSAEAGGAAAQGAREDIPDFLKGLKRR
ncbi:hypothetical protein TeGR_g15119 [Tetraparma gracilis]|uniref:Tubulin/FtsZ 2-layer sandwich domain-containing protein n=1 Tax=Tetraparma gracilis TaxID=2962635 RepID=A0ABQ6MBQ5_9STRA|nr:hypothetical protein TeGR_g15119 [Tetraparma gracilis]